MMTFSLFFAQESKFCSAKDSKFEKPRDLVELRAIF